MSFSPFRYGPTICLRSHVAPWERHSGTTPKQAAQNARLLRSNFSVVLRGLKKSGLVSVVPDAIDGRSV
jgi:DNA-binding MarR family transcriptional regulator